MAQLVFFTGTMDSGKSTLALQMNHNQAVRGRRGRLFTSRDRAGQAVVSSRLGLRVPAEEVTPDLDFWQYLVTSLQRGGRIDYLVCDEAQFYTRAQIDQLARIVDDLAIDVLAFGLLTDFRTRLFDGSARLVELADRIESLQVEALCWCGERATHNARTVGGVMVMEGEQIVIGDNQQSLAALRPSITPRASLADGQVVSYGSDPTGLDDVSYEVLCRRHHRRRLTAEAARAAELSPAVLPFDLIEHDGEA